MTNELIEYIKLHKLSLIQDRDKVEYDDYIDGVTDYLNGAIDATEHLLSVAEGIMNP